MSAPSLLARAGDLGARAAGRLGLAPRRLDADALLDDAISRAGLDDFGGEAFAEPYRLLVEALESEARLTALGRLMTRADLVRLLVNRLRLTEERKRHPGVASEEVRAPLVILGLPRTGTTLLHILLSLDPSNRVPRTWEVMHLPEPGGALDEAGRVRACRRRLRWFNRLVPDYPKIHATGPRLPQEDIAVTSHAFASVRFHRTHYVPSHRAWLEDADLGFAYDLHRRFLQHLQRRRGGGERWVLKTPAHLFELDTLLDTYPDARIVQTHREPLRALASNASQTRVLRSAFSSRPGRMDTDATLRRWAGALRDAAAVRAADPRAEQRFLDLRHGEIVEDPLREVRRLYDHFGLDLGAEAADRMRRWIREHPRDEHGVHRYTLEEFGIDRERHGSWFRDYREEHGV